MRIGMVLLSEIGFPPDIRVEKECRALSQAGHEIFVMTVAQNEADIGSVRYIKRLGVTVVNIAPLPKSLRLKFLDRLLIATRYWTDYIEEFITSYAVDVVHVHDLHALPPSVAAAAKIGRPIIADLHENMPAAFRAYRDWFTLHKKWLSRIIDNYYWMRWREKRLLKQCAHVIIVVPEAGIRLIDYGIEPNRISVVSNTENQTEASADSALSQREVSEKYKGRFVISYIGGVGPHRGIETSLQAVKSVKERIPNLLLLIVGVKDPKHLQMIRKKAERLDIVEQVEIEGWVPFEEVNRLICISDICLVPHNDYEHTHTTVPHKLFQYMLLKKPVLVSDCAPLMRIVEETESGQIFKASDPEDMAEKIFNMSLDQDALRKQGERGYLAATTTYNWIHDARRLETIYRTVPRHHHRDGLVNTKTSSLS